MINDILNPTSRAPLPMSYTQFSGQIRLLNELDCGT